MDSQPIADSSGYGKNATFTGSPRTTRPIVAKGIGAQLLGAGDVISYPVDSIMRAGREARSFTLEAWVKPIYGNTEILTRDNSGLFLDGLKLRFTIDMGALYSVEYKNLRAGEIYHVAAVYDGTGIYLFLNGVKVAGVDIDIPAPFDDTSMNLSSSTSSSVVLDSVATYPYALPASVIANHYVFGTDYPSVTDLSKINGGTKYDFIDDSVSVYAKAVFPETLTWSAGIADGTLASINNQLVNLYSDLDLEFQAGTWTYQESLEADAVSSIVSSRILWSASGDITVEKSEDGGDTWESLSNGGQIVSGMSLTSGYGVSIRVSIPVSVEQISVDYLSIAFYSSLTVRGDDEDLPATILNPAGTRVAERHLPAASFNDNAGITFYDSTSGMTIPGDEAFGGYFAIEMTVRIESGTNSATVLYVDTASAQPQVTTDSTGKWTFANLTALYVDGASITSGSAITTGEWHHVLAVFPESQATVYIGNGPTETAGYPMQIGHLATYSDTVSATDATAIYNAWVGSPSVTIRDGQIIRIGEGTESAPTVVQGLMTAGAVVGFDYGSSGWKYLLVPEGDSIDRSAKNFDDSSWTAGTGAFANALAPEHSNAGWSAPSTVIPVSTGIWMRKSVTLSASDTNVKLSLRRDGRATVFVNGTQIANYGDGVALADVIIPSNVIVSGANIITIHGVDDTSDPSGDYIYFDVGVAPSMRPKPMKAYQYDWAIVSGG